MSNPLQAKAVNAPRQPLRTQQTQAAPRKKRSLAVRSALWAPGQTLGVSFLGTPDPAFKQHVYSTAQQWLRYANLDFELRPDNDANAQIRIRTDGPPMLNRSILGKGPAEDDGSTMTLDARPHYVLTYGKTPDGQAQTIDANTRERVLNIINSAILHEFGHALGLHHEHLHPDANIPWNKDALRRNLIEQRPQGEMSDDEYAADIEDTLQDNYFLAPEADDRVLLPYDKQSIMHYEIASSDTLGGWALGPNHVLSAGDKQIIASLYPGRVAP